MCFRTRFVNKYVLFNRTKNTKLIFTTRVRSTVRFVILLNVTYYIGHAFAEFLEELLTTLLFRKLTQF
jgi:hypothetical protein